jgi:hypothetical protein
LSGLRGWLRIRRVLAAAFGIVAAAGVVFLVIGLLLSGRWEAERTVHISASPEAVLPYLDSLALWDEWTVWSEVESDLSGPGRGSGARRTWDDPRYGRGAFELVDSSPRGVTYHVEVEEGALTVDGALELSREGGGTAVRWTERGDFGRNPLLGYVARTMGRSQGAELERSLERLKSIVEAGPASGDLGAS